MSYLCSAKKEWTMVLEIVLIICGIAVVLWGADRFTDGACGLARRLRVSELVIGLTVVALGTSLPEFMVSFMSVLRGSSDMSVGNIIGSNVFNILVIIGASAIMRPMVVEHSMLRRDLPVCLAASALLFAFAVTEGTITRWEGLMLTAFFCAYLFMAYRIAMKDRRAASKPFGPPSLTLPNCSATNGQLPRGETSHADNSSPLRGGWTGSIMLILVGMLALVGGARILVDNAAAVAREWGVSESVIGMTILAAGTSLPEFATSVVAARKGSLGLAFGNAVGSNIFNIAFVIGICSSIVPMTVTEITQLDWAMLVGSCILVWIVAWSRRTINMWEGLLLVVCYLTYLVSLIVKG